LTQTPKDEPQDGRALHRHEASAEASAVPPRAVGRYAMYGEIASGGMATVHFGRLVGPAGFARPVAIKRLRPQYAADPDFVRMFLDEARMAARIAHPNVVPTLDVVDTEGEVFLVMEYVRGATLSHLVRAAKERGQAVPAIVSVGIVSAILQGLHAAHEATSDLGERLEIVHRDVSPQNVLIGIDGVTRLLDFGIAQASGRLQTTRDGTLKGKLSYMAPEQVRNEPISPQTDLYAAAVILWELLTGHRLFRADSEVGTITRVLSAPVARPSSIVAGVSPSLDAFTVRGLQRDPSNRFGSAREMAAELDACIGLASTADIGAWVERTVGDDLRKRASRIAAIERAAAEVGPPPSGRVMSSEVRVSGVVARANALPDAVRFGWDQTTRANGRGRTPDAAPESPRPPASAVQAGSRVRVWGGLASVAIVAAAVLAGVLRPKPADAPPRRGETAPLAASATAAPMIAPPPALPPSISGDHPFEETLAPTAPEPPTTAVAKGPQASAGPAAAFPRRAAGNPSAATGRDCAQPYTTDAKGHVHFKPSCL
jgi:hypothetical protein